MASTKNNFFFIKGIRASIANVPKQADKALALKIGTEISSESSGWTENTGI
jgi:hypothetical protein